MFWGQYGPVLRVSRPIGAGECQGLCKPIIHIAVAVARNTLKLGLCRQSPRKAMISTEPDFLAALCHGLVLQSKELCNLMGGLPVVSVPDCPQEKGRERLGVRDPLREHAC